MSPRSSSSVPARVPRASELGFATLAWVIGGTGALRRRAGLAAALLAALTFSACGDDSSGEATNIIEAGQVNIQLPDGYVLSRPGDEPAAAAPQEPAAVQGEGEAAAAAAQPGQPVAAGAATTAATADTIPLAEEDPVSKLFSAFAEFRSCLDADGVEFIGPPDANNPESPTNDPAYVKVLGTCAARSNILQALQEVQAAQADLTPEEIEQQNEGYLVWRDCMIDRGWKIPEPVPDADGRLLSFGGSNTPQIEGPAGEDPFTSPDFSECGAEAQREVEAAGD